MQVYAEEADKMGISLKECPHREKDFSLSARPGDYRHLLHKPRSLDFQLMSYKDRDQDLATTQLELLEGAAPQKPGVTLLPIQGNSTGLIYHSFITKEHLCDSVSYPQLAFSLQRLQTVKAKFKIASLI